MSDANVSAREAFSERTPDLICVSCSRWSALDEDRRRLLSRAAEEGRRVFFVETPAFDAGAFACVDLVHEEGVQIAVPHLPGNLAESDHAEEVLEGLMDEMLAAAGKRDYELWYDAPTPAEWFRHSDALAVTPMIADDAPAAKTAKTAAGGSR